MNENEKQKKNSKTRDLNKKQRENNDLFLWKRAPWLYLKWSGTFGEVQNVNDKVSQANQLSAFIIVVN